MKIFSTFTGIGGFEIGVHNAYRQKLPEQDSILSDNSTDSSGLRQWREQDAPSTVGYSEVDKYAISVYERNFPNVRNYGDITQINEEELPDFDCLVGGFPCQAFSIAGKRGGFNDTRGTLFFDLARILRAKQPRYFVFENVKGLLSHDKGNTFRTIITTIDELGYDCQWSVLNSKNFGVPQNRERIIIVGHLRGTPRPQVFPITGTDSADTYIRTIRTGGASSFTEKHARDIIRVGNVNPSGRGMNGNVISSDGLSSTISTNKGEGIKVLIPEATKKGYAEASAGQAINLTADSEMRIRRLTPLETERLQAFPDNWTKYGRDGELISDTQRYKMCGNAVTTNVIQAVFERIMESA